MRRNDGIFHLRHCVAGHIFDSAVNV